MILFIITILTFFRHRKIKIVYLCTKLYKNYYYDNFKKKSNYKNFKRNSIKMEKNLYIDASHPNETRIVLKSDRSIEEYEFEDKNNLNFKNNIYLATISRVEPSLQAAFVNFGRERHGFLAFNDIQSDYYQLPSEDKEKIRIAEEKIREELKEKVNEENQENFSSANHSENKNGKTEDNDNQIERQNNKQEYREKVKSSLGIKRYKIQRSY